MHGDPPPEPAPDSSYVFAGAGEAERARLDLLARLTDPLHRRALSQAGLRAGLRCLELGAGTGTVAAWLAGRTGPEGQVLATDIDLSFLDGPARPPLEIRRVDAVKDELPPAAFDVVTASALLHHLPQWESVVDRMAAALAPGGALVLVEPDVGAALLGRPEHRRFWADWCRWGRSQGIDYGLGRKLPDAVRRAGLDVQDVTMEVPFYDEGSPWDTLYRATLQAIRPRLAGWDGPDLVAAYDRLPTGPGRPACGLGWTAVVGRAPGTP
ncbi:methyltransferase domain-containing protein [Streptomyces sp. NPDC090025]|uniref:methyltransferase domain-containing protein n=1 Tax=Streptomyces sp. NPDC090025 TaxID=3365922 RepID=UPI003836D875